ncbi:MAG: hypothetical protein ACYTGC_18615, partial [Planctomycetota bacterium]
MQTQRMTVEDLFERALERETPAERNAFLDGACAGDGDLRDRVDALIRAHEAAGDFLATPAMAEPDTVDSTPSEVAGTIIGRYKLLQK